MASNIIGNTFLLAETAVQHETQDKASSDTSSRLHSDDAVPDLELEKKLLNTASSHRLKLQDIVWKNVLAFLYLHAAVLYGFYLFFFGTAKASTFLIAVIYGYLGAFGITAGAHRHWAHKAYKAKWPLKLILMICNTIAFQNSLYEWVRDHRVHHKYTDTDADPHNVSRGIFFAHMGWLMVKKHPDVKNKGAAVDMTDLELDPFVMFQKKHYLWMMPVLTFVIPTIIPWYLTGESISNSWYFGTMTRYCISLHSTWLVNSAAHVWGSKPYDRFIKSSNNVLVAIATFGEGWHNYHHVFPWDYKTAEMGNYSLNFTTGFIDFFAKIGWAYDLKTVSEDMILKRAARTGDGSNAYSEIIPKGGAKQRRSDLNIQVPVAQSPFHHDNMVWGWDDQDMTAIDKKDALIINKMD